VSSKIWQPIAIGADGRDGFFYFVCGGYSCIGGSPPDAVFENMWGTPGM